VRNRNLGPNLSQGKKLAAAAGQDQKRNDNDPDAVVVVKKIAEAVIHNSSSVSESM
jgi:hypothetical protein